MAKRSPPSEWCTRLENAILDGRLLEDLALWRPHYEQCDTCRPRAEGYLLLVKLIEVSRPPAAPPLGPGEAKRIFEATLTGHRARVRRRRIGWTLGLLAVLGIGVGFVALRRGDPGESPPQTALEPALGLLDVLRTPQGNLDGGRLRSDPTQQAAFIAALDDPQLGVRAVAFIGLALAGQGDSIPDLDRRLQELRTAPERLRAQFGDRGSTLASEVDRARESVLSLLLVAAVSTPEGRPPLLSEDLVVALLREPSASIRTSALLVLERLPDYTAGDEVWWTLLHDDDLVVRHEAAAVWLARGGADAQDRLIEHLRGRPEHAFEARIVGILRPHAGAFELAAERTAAPAVPLEARLAWAGLLIRESRPFAREALVASALASSDPNVHVQLALRAAQGGWVECRAPLQDLWRRAAGEGEQLGLGALLANWDVTRPDADLAWTLEILQAGRNVGARPALKALLEHADHALRTRAQEIAKSWETAR
ncbi:MAG: hypothetical protein ACKOCB_12410 [Planctomycetia bacterium]